MDKDISYINTKYLRAILTKKAYKSLSKFMYGQTGILTDDGQFGIYLWDFEKWMRNYNEDVK